MRIVLRVGRVQDQAVDAVVRAAPRGLLARTGDEVLTAAGPEVLAACRRLRHSALRQGLAPAEAVVTGAGGLPAMWLIHVRVPGFRVEVDQDHLLARAYRSVLAAADEVAATHLALAPLGTHGPYWPLGDTVRIGLGTLLNASTRVQRVTLVCGGPGLLEAFAEGLARQ